MLLYTVEIIIGFENTTYTVDEGIGSQNVCLRLFVDESIELPFEGDLFAAVETVAGTAGEFKQFTSSYVCGLDITITVTLLQMRLTTQELTHSLE